MNIKEIEKLVTQILSDILEVPTGDITADADILEELGADSLMILEVMARLETDFAISIDQAKLAEMTSSRAISEIVLEATRLVAA